LGTPIISGPGKATDFKFYRNIHNVDRSGVARMLTAPVQRHVVGPLVIKQLSNAFAARNGRTVAVNSRAGYSVYITVVRNTVVKSTIVESTF